MSVTVEKGKAAEIKGVKRVRGKQIAPCLSFKESDAKKTAHAKGKAAQRKAAEINGVKRVRGKQKAPCQSTKESDAKKTAWEYHLDELQPSDRCGSTGYWRRVSESHEYQIKSNQIAS